VGVVKIDNISVTSEGEVLWIDFMNLHDRLNPRRYSGMQRLVFAVVFSTLDGQNMLGWR
jgi:hypothetical protein